MFALEQGLRPVTATRGGTRWSLFRVWHVLSSRTEKPGLAGSRTAPGHMPIALHAWPHLPLQLDASLRRAPTRGAPTVEIVCNRVRHTDGPIRFRQQLSACYLWLYSDLRAPGAVPAGATFSPGYKTTKFPETGQTDSLSSTTRIVPVCFFLVRMAVCNRVEHTNSQGEGRPYSRDLFATSDTQTGRSIRFRQQLLPSTSGSALILESPIPCLLGGRYPLDDQRDQVPKDGQYVSFSSTTIRFYLWQRPDPSVSGTVLLGRRFSPVPERPGFQENTQTAKGTYERCPYRYGSFRNRVNMRKTGRSVSVNNCCLLPLVML